MIKNSVVDTINKELKKHGSNEYGDPNFRVVFSDEQTERRKVTSKNPSKILLLFDTEEIKEVKKYPWIKRKWILERWSSGETHKDLQNFKSGIYICIYIFQDKNNNYLPPLLKVTEIIVNRLLNPISRRP